MRIEQLLAIALATIMIGVAYITAKDMMRGWKPRIKRMEEEENLRHNKEQ